MYSKLYKINNANIPNSISPELIRKRKQLVVGKQLLFSTEIKDFIEIALDMNFDPLMVIQQVSVGTLIYCNTSIISTIEALQSQGIQLNFIIKIRVIRLNPIDLSDLSDLISDLHPIDDAPSNIINQIDYFEKISNSIEQLLYHDKWGFDEITAQKTLDEINNEIRAQQDFLDF